MVLLCLSTHKHKLMVKRKLDLCSRMYRGWSRRPLWDDSVSTTLVDEPLSLPEHRNSHILQLVVAAELQHGENGQADPTRHRCPRSKLQQELTFK